MAVSGGALLVGGGESIGVDTTGVILSLGAGLAYAVFAVEAKGLLDNHPPLAVMAVTLTGGAVVLLPLVVGANLAWVGTAQGQRSPFMWVWSPPPWRTCCLGMAWHGPRSPTWSL